MNNFRSSSHRTQLFMTIHQLASLVQFRFEEQRGEVSANFGVSSKL